MKITCLRAERAGLIKKDMRNFLNRRRAHRRLAALLNHARRARNLWEDVVGTETLRRVAAAEAKSREALQAGQCNLMLASAKELEQATIAMLPVRSLPSLRDNIEMIVVAVAVAMAFRSYFVQPFKIPTSSMHPTLHGITYKSDDAGPGLYDKLPFALFRWMAFGERHVQVRSQESGCIRFREGPQRDTTIFVNGVPHAVEEGMRIRVAPRDKVIRGQILATGIRKNGDHILVYKIAWNFRRPRRGEIMVFRTDNIQHPQIKQNEYYVKRLVGLPGEVLSISDPYLEINGARVANCETIERIQNCESGYVGYKRAGRLLEDGESKVLLGPDDYYACGDNQLSSLDSRYWGPVPRKNLVGPAFFVYWPFTCRWGIVD